MPETPQVFISYARKDGEEFATKLRKRLETEHPEITLWQDRTRMEGGVGWWKQITEALENAQFLVLVMTPAAMQSTISRKEWRYARQQGLCVYPVKGVPDTELDWGCVPRWMSKAHFFDLDREWETFINHLKSHCQAVRVPFIAPDLPEGFVDRPMLIEQLMNQLLDKSRENPVTVTTALLGAGGLGKTTLAAALCHHDDIITAFDDGVLWVTLGQKPQIQAALTKLYVALTGEHPGFIDEEDAAFHLAQKLEDKDCLMVLDDVWDTTHLQPFLRGGAHCARLITTRNFDVVAGTKRLNVDEMTPSEAVQLLTARLPTPPDELTRFQNLAERLGKWPLLLELGNGTLRQLIERGETLEGALNYLHEKLNDQGIAAFDQRTPLQRNRAITKTIETSLDLLTPDECERCLELAIFPEDSDIPLRIVGHLWGLKALGTKELALRLDNLSLLKFNLQVGTIRLHDVMRAYLTSKLANPEKLHGKLVDAWGDPHHLTELYAWRWLPYHLISGQRTAELRRLLADFSWLRANLEATDIGTLVAHYDYLMPGDSLRIVQDTLRLAAPYLAADKCQLASQLVGRLRPRREPDVDALIASARNWRGEPWLRPLRPTLHAPGGPLVRVFRGYAGGHRGSVRSIAIDSEGHWAVSAGNSHPDQCVIIWNLATGTHRRLEGQAEEGGYTPLVITDNGEIFGSAYGEEVRIWRVTDGSQIDRLPACGSKITALAIAKDGKRWLAGTDDGSVFCWHSDSHTIKQFGKHRGGVEAIALTPDGSRAISINYLGARLWDANKPLRMHGWRTPGFHRPMNTSARCLALSDDGRYVTWGGYYRAWQSRDGRGASFEGPHLLMEEDTVTKEQYIKLSHPHINGVLCYSTIGRRAIVLREDGEAAVVELDAPPRLTALPKIGRGVTSAVISHNGRWGLTADYEHDLMLWDLDRASANASLEPETGHEWKEREFNTFSGHFSVFGLDTESPLIWDLIAEAPVTIDELLVPLVKSLRDQKGKATTESNTRVRRRKRAVSSEDRQRGHSAPVHGKALAPHKRWDATASEDGTVRVWNVIEKRQLAVFSDETIFRYCRWADDGVTLAVTDYLNRAHLLRLEGVLIPTSQEDPDRPMPPVS